MSMRKLAVLEYIFWLFFSMNIILVGYVLLGDFSFEGLFFLLKCSILFIICFVFTLSVLGSFNYIVSIVYLIFLFSVSGLVLMFCGMNFVGLTLIAVYVGGVLLLFLSVIKFLGFKAGDSQNSFSLNSVIVLSFFVVFVFAVMLLLFNLHN